VIRTIRDPEKPNTLEELDVVTEKCVSVQELGDEEYLIIIKFSPTVPHCSLATLIGVYLGRVRGQVSVSGQNNTGLYNIRNITFMESPHEDSVCVK